MFCLGAVVGLVYERGGADFQLFGPVILASGGIHKNITTLTKQFILLTFCSSKHFLYMCFYMFCIGFGADFGNDSLLAKHRPDLLHLPTTNGAINPDYILQKCSMSVVREDFGKEQNYSTILRVGGHSELAKAVAHFHASEDILRSQGTQVPDFAWRARALSSTSTLVKHALSKK